eukprot:scaffold2979_cov243-Pinguiococcus_pyrenoidosus.AAC.12
MASTAGCGGGAQRRLPTAARGRNRRGVLGSQQSADPRQSTHADAEVSWCQEKATVMLWESGEFCARR